MSRDEAALIHAICDDPDDDTPRLAYADWLEEHGHLERAEFVRVQVRMARLPSDSPDLARLVWRARELFHHHHEKESFKPKVPRALEQFNWSYHRGFVTKIRGTAARFIKSANGLLRHFPLEQVELTNAEGRITALADVPELSRIRHLELDTYDGDPSEVLGVLDSPHLTRLSSLNLQRTKLDVGQVKRLARKQRLAQLSELQPGQPGDQELIALLKSPYLNNLTTLDLSWGDFSTTGIQALLDSPNLPRLASLKLTPPVGLDGIEMLAGWSRLQDLTALSLYRVDRGDTGVRILVRESAVPRLTALALPHNDITRTGVEELLSWKGLEQLTELDLGGNPISAEGLRMLVRSPRLARLTHLHVYSIGDPEECARALAKAPGLPLLHTITIESDDGRYPALWKRFSRWAFFSSLGLS
jgi:uncharacterized protein (TIGR02996 family)